MKTLLKPFIAIATLIFMIGLFIVLRLMELLNGWQSRIGRTAFLDKREFGWLPPIEAQSPLIRRELMRLLESRTPIPAIQDLMPDQKSLSNNNDWKTYMLYFCRRRIDDHCHACPETARLLETIPGLETAFFSILAPGKHIPPHRGLYNGLVRFHLGLLVPPDKENCRIRVGEEWRHWEEGVGMTFDDTYIHEVRNDTNSTRVVLFVDFERPLAFPASAINALLLRIIGASAGVRQAIERMETWTAEPPKPEPAKTAVGA